MILECIINRVAELPEIERAIVRQHVHSDALHLVRGKRYVVYGIVFRAGLPWYLVIDDNDAEYPRPEFAGFFDVVNNAIPPGWRFMWRCGPWPDGALLPSEWCASGFFEALLDGGSNEVALFKAKKVEIESESQGLQ